MCSFEIPQSLYGIHIDISTNEQPREFFMEYIETLPHIKKINYKNMTVWYILEFSEFTKGIFRKFQHHNIGDKVRNFPWKTTLVSTYHNGLITQINTDKSVYDEYIYGEPHYSFYARKPPSFDTVTLSTQQLYNLTN